MKEFHRVMAESNAVLRYNSDHIIIQLSSCSLKTLKELADEIYAEFGLQSDSVQVFSENGTILLRVSLINQEEDLEEQLEKRKETSLKEMNAAYNAKILQNALEILSEHENGLTSEELQQELAKRGIVSSTWLIGRLLNESGKAQKARLKWTLNKDSEEEHPDWTFITDNACYRIENENVVLGRVKLNNKIQIVKRFQFEALKKLYSLLPDESTVMDLIKLAKTVGIEGTPYGYYLMRVLAREFGGEVIRKDKQVILVKGEGDPDE